MTVVDIMVRHELGFTCEPMTESVSTVQRPSARGIYRCRLTCEDRGMSFRVRIVQ